jgi:hypothetical protein
MVHKAKEIVILNAIHHRQNPLEQDQYFIYGSTALLNLGRFFSFLILYTVGRNPWMGDQPLARPLPTHRTTQTQNKRTQTSMPRVVFEPTIPVFERAKIVHALDRATTVIGRISTHENKM